ncbi:MAG: glycoside hydrolase family 88 protein, partial [Clostridia bacterium]|nr:glycoside hydrolase family 88 protein [Clostridia bacterium]
CPFHWLRASGWYQMAQADVLECLSGADRRALSADFEKLSRALLRFRDPKTGMWNNLIDQSAENGNRAESSGTAMMAYSLQKGARLGLLPAELGEAGRDAFVRLTEEKLKGDALTDVYLVAAASGEDNYRNEAYYMPQEGKGVGPYIMAYAEMLRRG